MPTRKAAPRKTRRSPLEQEVAKALGKLTHAVDGPSSVEMLQLASMQVIQHKLDEISQLLGAFGVPSIAVPNIPTPHHAPPPSPRTPTMDDVRKEVEAHDRAAGAQGPRSDAKPCEICGLPGAYKTLKGAIYCEGHKQMGISDDQQDKLQSMLRLGFGKPGARGEEVIRVDAQGQPAP